MTIEGVDIGKVRNFPFSALKTLGSIQIGIGGICIGLGIIDFLLFIFFEDKFVPDAKTKETEAYQKVDTLTKTFSPVWCGIWVRVLLAKQQDDNFHAIVQKEKSKDSFDIFTTSDRRGNPLPPRNQEIKQKEEAKQPTVQKVDRKQHTTAKDDKRPPPAPKEERRQEKSQTDHRTGDSKRSHDRKAERKDSFNSEDYKHKDDEEFDGSRFEENNPVRTRGYADRPYTKGSSYEQLKSLVIPKTAPKQTF
ncbi:unnamed protein product [Mytilus coruscus]|uniref:Uncharacterized protein n=1 Tax=Mytilus coruscus TaxID=42192 RepID=A0A6J8C615_MYTCO|nr:unnamed protein product [Mytilus coruscus]